MSDIRDFRFWGEANSVKGGEYRDSDNNAIRLYQLDDTHAGYQSLITALTPAAEALGATPVELFDALKVLDPVPSQEEPGEA